MQAAPGLTELIGAPRNVINTLSDFKLTFSTKVGREFKSSVQFTISEFSLKIRMFAETEMYEQIDREVSELYLEYRANETVDTELNLEFPLFAQVDFSSRGTFAHDGLFSNEAGIRSYEVIVSINSRDTTTWESVAVPFREHVSTTKLLAICSNVLRDFDIPWSIEMDNKLATVYELFQEPRYVEIKETGAFKEDLSQRRKYRDLKNKARGEISDELRYAPPRGTFRGGLEFQRAS